MSCCGRHLCAPLSPRAHWVGGWVGLSGGAPPQYESAKGGVERAWWLRGVQARPSHVWLGGLAMANSPLEACHSADTKVYRKTRKQGKPHVGANDERNA